MSLSDPTACCHLCAVHADRVGAIAHQRLHGNSLLGLLRTAPAKVLGMISYSIYLIHCIALFVTVRAVDAVRPIETIHSGQYWLLAWQPGRAHSEGVS